MMALPSYYKLKEAFDQKQIPAWFAEWGHDIARGLGMVTNKYLISLVT